ncbi:ketopantoate reductase family protein [Gorillibacterium sp. sgz5001074]|uniref:ketopantoate reductase family protein n=1 Tax=Gorillibacterium sp. sgz5001074 TaxID=3446695 RepID=UPI003F67E13E
MRIDCIGGGSIGLLLASKLAAAGATIRVVTRSEEQASRIAGSGLTIREGGRHNHTEADSVSIASYSGGPGAGIPRPDWILLAVKQKDITDELIRSLSMWCGPGTSICCFQNGIGHVDKLRAAAVAAPVYAAVTTEGARRTELHAVDHTGSGKTWIGEPGGKVREPEQLRSLLSILVRAGFEAELSNSIDREIWNKLIINTVINPVTALLGVPNGRLLDSTDALALMRSLFQEASGVAEVLGIGIADDLWERLLAVCRATERNRSSMLQDMEAGRRTELEWLNGSLLRVAGRLGLDLPVHGAVYRLVRCRESWNECTAGTEGSSDDSPINDMV